MADPLDVAVGLSGHRNLLSGWGVRQCRSGDCLALSGSFGEAKSQSEQCTEDCDEHYSCRVVCGVVWCVVLCCVLCVVCCFERRVSKSGGEVVLVIAAGERLRVHAER